MVDANKLYTYVRFAIKSGAIIYGTDSIISAKGKCQLILASRLLADNAMRKLKKIGDITIMPPDEFENLFGRPKAVAITDANLAKAIKQNI